MEHVHAMPTRLERTITQEEIDAYQADGATVIRGVVPSSWIETMREAVQRILDAPGVASIEYTPKGKSGRYYGDFFLWMRDRDFRAFMCESPMPEIAAQVLGSRNVYFFYDQLLVKEPNTAEPTPWHQDLVYWPVRGQDILSIWVPLDIATVDSGVVQYLRGSHRWGRKFAPQSFGNSTGFSDLYAKSGYEPLPPDDVLLAGQTVLAWDMEPGDVLIHHPLTLHYAKGNASTCARRRGLALRYLGDDACWDARTGTFMDNPKVRSLFPPVTLEDGDGFLGCDAFPQVWPR